MALCRCIQEHIPINGNYVGYFEPIGFPNTSSICGRVNCNHPGYIWLTQEELDQFNPETMLIKLSTASIKVRVQNQFTYLR